MAKIRILIVDDSVVVRRMVADLLSSDPALEVAGTAPNGRIALAKLPQVNPDLVLLDVEMPEMNGLETLAALRKTYPRLPVIMFSRFTKRGAAVTLDALTLGASDYVTMPESVSGAAAGVPELREQLVFKIKELCPLPAVGGEGRGRGDNGTVSTTGGAGPASTSPRLSALGITKPQRVDILAIGTSTGGPNALATLLAALPGDCPVPIVIVQHMPPAFTALLAERLAARTALDVGEAILGHALYPGRAWIAPGDYHMELARDAQQAVRLRLHQGPPENSCRPSVDVLFRSVAEVYGAGTLAVVLTGMGQDGLRGSERIREVGGQVLAQDEATSVVWGMPGLVARADLADQVLPLDQLAPEIVRRLRRGRTLSSSG
jgi:two-component system, chemotaxis family, protein-glutamate methylesterase/glutaminase